MRAGLRTKALEWGKVAAILLLAILIGIGMALASSPASLR